MDEKTQALERLTRATEEFVAALDGASDAQWRFEPADGGWSLAATAEHVARSNQLIAASIATQLAPLGERRATLPDEDIPGIFQRTGPAPNLAEPKGRWPERRELVALLRAAPDETRRALADKQGNLRTWAAPHPIVGVLDGVQMILFQAAHTDSHTRQLRAIQGEPGYPVA